MATLSELNTAFLNADESGDFETAGFLATLIKDERSRRETDGDPENDEIPGLGSVGASSPSTMGMLARGIGQSAIDLGADAMKAVQFIGDPIGSMRPNAAIQAVEGIDTGYRPMTTTEDVKQAEGVVDTVTEGVKFGLEQGVVGVPHMVAALTAFPAYVASQTVRIGEERAKNNGKPQADYNDILQAAPFALGSAIFERFGAKGITQAGANNVAKEALETGFRQAITRVGKEGVEAGSKEAFTEAVQEGVIDYLGETLGTKKTLDLWEGMERGGFGALSGGTFGGALGTTAAAARSVPVSYAQSEQVTTDSLQQNFDAEASPSSVFQPSEPLPEGESVFGKIGETVGGVVDSAKNKFGMSKPEADQGGSVGAAQLSRAEVLNERVQELPQPLPIFQSQLTGDQGGKQFLSMLGKEASEEGEQVRGTQNAQNLGVAQNVELFLDMTGEQFSEKVAKGEVVVGALESAMNQDRERVKTLYDEAEALGELEDPLELTNIINYLNDHQAEAINSGLLRGVEAKLLDRHMRAAKKKEVQDDEGETYTILEPRKVTLNEAEQIRKFVNRHKPENDNDKREATNIRGAHNADTEGKGGNRYKSARRHAQRFIERYSGNDLIENLTQTKNGSNERKVAVEKMAEYVALSPLATGANLKHARVTLKREGELGQQAWREVQGAVLRKMLTQMMKTTKRDSDGNPIPSYNKLRNFLDPLNESGKLEIIFGKKGAEQINTLASVVELLYTDQPGTVNHSDTSTIMAFMVDMIGSSVAGLPLPLASGVQQAIKGIKNKQVRDRLAIESGAFTNTGDQ